MSRGIPLLVAVACLLLSATSAAASYYRGEGDGVTVEMRVRFGKIAYARVETTLYCTPRPAFPGGPPHTKPLRFYVGPNAGDDANSIYYRKIPVGRRGGFKYFSESSSLDETGSSETLFAGRVSGSAVLGWFRDRGRYDEDCRTGGFLTYGDSDREMETLRFKAERS